MYMRNRSYDPQSGRFTQEDPIGIAGGLNVYGFANGDPVSYSDPYGLCPIMRNGILIPCAVAGMGIGATAGGIVGAAIGGGGAAAVCSPTGPGAVACAAGGGLGGAEAGAGAGGTLGFAVGYGMDLVAEIGEKVESFTRHAAADASNWLFSKRDLKQIQDVAREFGIGGADRRDFGDFLEEEKAAGHGGTANRRGDFTYDELRRKAREFLGLDK
jgi:hypothetical protein